MSGGGRGWGEWRGEGTSSVESAAVTASRSMRRVAARAPLLCAVCSPLRRPRRERGPTSDSTTTRKRAMRGSSAESPSPFATHSSRSVCCLVPSLSAQRSNRPPSLRRPISIVALSTSPFFTSIRVPIMSISRVCVALMVALMALVACGADARPTLDSGVPVGSEQLRQHSQRPLLKHPALVDAMDGNGTLPKFPKLGKVYVSGVSSGGGKTQTHTADAAARIRHRSLSTDSGLVQTRWIASECSKQRMSMCARVARQPSLKTDRFSCCFVLVVVLTGAGYMATQLHVAYSSIIAGAGQCRDQTPSRETPNLSLSRRAGGSRAETAVAVEADMFSNRIESNGCCWLILLFLSCPLSPSLFLFC